MAELTWTPSASETVFTEVTGTFTFNDDDVRAVYIDWDDGTNPAGTFTNKKEYANYQWYEVTEPTGAIAVTHTYTATGTFDPVIQVVNSEGIFSAYQGNAATNTDITPYFQSSGGTSGAGYDTITMADGAATGIMRVENKSVKSGIDNSIFNVEGSKDLFVMVAPTLSTTELAYLCETGAAATGKVEIDVTCLLDYGVRDGTGAANTVQVDTGGERIVKTLPLVLSGANLTGSVTGIRNVLASGAHNLGALESGARVAQVLEVKYKNPKYLGTDESAYTQNEVYNRFKVFFVAKSDTISDASSASAGQPEDTYVTVTYITPGDPIKKANDPLRNFTLDFSQSRAKASNVSLASYRYDIGKIWFQSADAWGTGSATTFSDATSGTRVTKRGAYTYMPRPDGLRFSEGLCVFNTGSTSKWDTAAANDIRDQVVLDDYGRFPTQYHLTRMSAEPSSSAGNVSSITSNKPEVYRITPACSWSVYQTDDTNATAAHAAIFPTKILDSGALDNKPTNGSKSKDYTVNAFNNSGTGYTDASGKINLFDLNRMNFLGVDDAARANAREYILLMFDEKTNKVFFNLSPLGSNMAANFGTSDPEWGIAGVYYLAMENKDTPKQNAYWSPLEFNDTTAIIKEYRDTTNDKYTTIKAPLSKSGYISFDMPLDWNSISLSGACGGLFNSTTSPTGTGSAFDIGAAAATGTVGTAVGGTTTIGDYIPFTMTTNPIPSTYTNTDIGSFKYIFISTAGSAVKGAYWISKDGADGYESDNDKIYLHLGDKDDTTGTGITQGYIRRVNVYDILDGFSKVFMPSGGSATKLFTVGNDDTPSAGAGWDSDWDNTYNILSSNTVGAALISSWASEKYLLKVVLSGATEDTNNLYPEIWNVFDGNQGFEDIIEEVDASAYNLNALPISSDISVRRGGAYFSAITRKGKVFITRTGDTLESISFSSVALGDESTFDTFSAPSSLYGQLKKIRGLHGNTVRAYWDEPQKDGTFTRYWGIITSVDETHGTGGPRSVVSYNFNLRIEEIALLDTAGRLMTDVFPLGGVLNDKDYT